MGEVAILAEVPRSDLTVSQEILKIKTDSGFLEKAAVLAQVELVAKKIQVRSDEVAEKAVETKATAKRVLKDLEETRQRLVAFPQKFVTKVNSIMGPSSTLVKQANAAIKMIDGKESEWRRKKRLEAEREALEAQKRLDAEMEKARAKAEKAGVELPKEPQVKAAVPTQAKTIRTESGASSYTRKVWTYEIQDFKKMAKAALDGKLPLEVIMANDKLIGSLVSNGMRTIPGVKVYQEEKNITRI